MPFVTRQRRGARCEAAGLEKPEVYSLKYIEDVFEPSTTQVVQIVRRSRTVNVGQAPSSLRKNSVLCDTVL